ncbi:uncharacterized protein LOC133722879 [Rosa rugosa]|uniref:uncharacterized protein LOC133722879 n=1 Tax=Rosa rugosa TaxID=74645 RepID=UPI002B401D29|nr:uncharacterized protein LOC133722879 [Rosa rugosa]
MNGIWSFKFLEIEARTILSIPLSRSGGQDKLIWHYHKSGRFTVKSGYWVAAQEKSRKAGLIASSSNMDGRGGYSTGWRRLWGLQLPNKIKVFLRRACIGFLPCAAVLRQRRVCNSAMCGACGFRDESVLHALWECTVARQVWKCTFLAEWDVYLRSCVGQEEKNELASRRDVGSHVQQTIRWRCPRPGAIKLNVDRALKIGQGTFGTGAVCRDEARTCIGVLAVPGKGYLSPQTCEFLALINGLHFSHLEIEGDAQNIFAALASNQEDLSSEGALVDEAKPIIGFKSREGFGKATIPKSREGFGTYMLAVSS